jgi:hypothetical protein
MPQRGRRNVDGTLLMTLACGATWDAAAQKAGVSRATVQRRMQDPEFCKELQQLRADMVQRAAKEATDKASDAAKGAAQKVGQKVEDLGQKIKDSSS